ncbi:Amino acid ABC transporter periplasmic amino acid-binding protein, partial [Pseudomonas cichorii]
NQTLDQYQNPWHDSCSTLFVDRFDCRVCLARTPLKHSLRNLNKNEFEDSSMRIVPQLLGAAIAATLISTPVLAEELTGTLKKIKESGTITLGHRDASIPFSYIADASG